MSDLSPKGQILQRAVVLRRYENQLGVDVAREVKTARNQLAIILQNQDLTVVSPGRVAVRLNSIADKADQVLHDAYVRINTLTRRELYDLGKISGTSTAADISRIARQVGVDLTDLGLPTPDQLRAIVTANPVQGAVMKDWWDRQEDTTANAFRVQVQLGMTRSETNAQIVQRIRGTSIGGGRFAGGVMDTSQRQAVTLVRTAVQTVFQSAAQLTYKENSDILQGWEFLATEDNRTCPECGELDGTIYAIDDPKAPAIPLHYGCRCTSIGVLDYSAVGADTPSTPDRQTYPQWFDNQDSKTQDAILGPGRAQLVRNGDATLGDLMRSDGSRATLEELRAAA